MPHAPRLRLLRPLACLLLIAAAGCTLQPKYDRPNPPLPAEWHTNLPSQSVDNATTASPQDIPDNATIQDNATGPDWHAIIPDKPLRDLVELALKNNRDLRAAAARIEKAQAAYHVQRGDLFPKIDAFAKAELNPNTKKRLGNNTNAYHSYVVGVGFSNYELDFFGHVRSQIDQTIEYYLSTTAAHRTAELSLVAQVGTIYLRTVADREHLDAEREILKSMLGVLELVKERHKEGAASDIDLAQAQMNADITRTNVHQFEAQVTADENNLGVLVGVPLTPEQIPARRLADVQRLTRVAPSLPSDVLFRRPDVLEAEHLLKAANANIGAARALHFPLITLTSSVGTASDKLNGLFKAGSWGWSLSPQISLPIFHTGAIRATVNEAIADRDVYLAQYDKAIQTAFQEVSDALAQDASLRGQVKAQSSLTQASAKTYELVTLREAEGRDSLIDKLNAQRAYALAQHDWIRARYFHQVNLLTLYKALGGAWAGEDPNAGPSMWPEDNDPWF